MSKSRREFIQSLALSHEAVQFTDKRCRDENGVRALADIDGHYSPEDAPKRIAALIAAFLRAVLKPFFEGSQVQLVRPGIARLLV